MNIEELEIMMNSDNKEIRSRAFCLLLRLRDKLSTKEVAASAGVSQRTVERYVKQFKESRNLLPKLSGRPSALSELDNMLDQSPIHYGYLLDKWTPQILQNETGITYSSCRRVLEKAGQLGSINDAILQLREEKRLSSLLQKKSNQEEQLWFTHSFQIGDDRGRKPKGLIDYVKQFHCFISVSMFEPYFLVDIQAITTRTMGDDSPRNTHLRHYRLFLLKVCNFVLEQFDTSTKLLFPWTPINRSVVATVKSDLQAFEQQQQNEKQKSKNGHARKNNTVIAKFLPSPSYEIYDDMISFETFLIKEFILLKCVDSGSPLLLKDLSTKWWNQHHLI
jgi:transposase